MKTLSRDKVAPPTTAVGPIDALIELLARLPGIGQRTATRMALQILQQGKPYTHRFSQVLATLTERVRLCSQCLNLAETEPCAICRDPKRDRGLVCVVETIPDLLAFQRVPDYRGVFYVLHGALAPLDGVMPEDLKVGPLIERARRGEVREVILATSPNLAGETTALYVSHQLQGMPVKVSRIAQGVPAGSDLGLADQITLTRALQGRGTWPSG